MNRTTQFLQGRYNRVRDAGASHRDFVIANDLSDEVAKELEQNYDLIKDIPKPPAALVQIELDRQALARDKKRLAISEMLDDFHWLTDLFKKKEEHSMGVKAIQEKYNLFRDAGGDHNDFVTANFLTSEESRELLAQYDITLDKPKSSEYENRVLECRESLWQYSQRESLTYQLSDPRGSRFLENPYLHVVPRPPIALAFLSY